LYRGNVRIEAGGTWGKNSASAGDRERIRGQGRRISKTSRFGKEAKIGGIRHLKD